MGAERWMPGQLFGSVAAPKGPRRGLGTRRRLVRGGEACGRVVAALCWENPTVLNRRAPFSLPITHRIIYKRVPESPYCCCFLSRLYTGTAMS